MQDMVVCRVAVPRHCWVSCFIVLWYDDGGGVCCALHWHGSVQGTVVWFTHWHQFAELHYGAATGCDIAFCSQAASLADCV